MKKEIVLFLIMSSMNVMNAAMNEKNRPAQSSTKQPIVCCPRSYAVPPCAECAKRRFEKNPEEKKIIPLPLSSSREIERGRLER